MLASITPLGERGRSNRWGATVAAHLIGSVALASAQGALLGAAGAAVDVGARARTVLAAATVLSAVLLDVRLAPRPGLHRQVAEGWLDTYRGWVYGAGFGAQLGVGWATIVTTWLVWAALGGMLLAGGVAGGALVGAAFGLGRALPVVSSWRVRDGDGLRDLHRRLAAWEDPFRRASLVAASLLAVGLAAAA